MNLTQAKSFDGPGHWDYDRVHRLVGAEEQSNPCTCQIKAKENQGSATYPSLIEYEDADPDCELHFPWMLDDPQEAVNTTRTWFAGYQVGFDTATDSHRDAHRNANDPDWASHRAMTYLTDREGWVNEEDILEEVMHLAIKLRHILPNKRFGILLETAVKLCS
jgi:hypothetical protein